MTFQESLAVSGLPVFSIDISCLRIVDDLHFEIGDVLKSCLLLLDGIGQDMKLGVARQIVISTNSIFGEAKTTE